MVNLIYKDVYAIIKKNNEKYVCLKGELEYFLNRYKGNTILSIYTIKTEAENEIKKLNKKNI